MSYIEQNMRNISKYIVSLPFFSSLEFVLSVRLSFCLIFDFMLHRGGGGGGGGGGGFVIRFVNCCPIPSFLYVTFVLYYNCKVLCF